MFNIMNPFMFYLILYKVFTQNFIIQIDTTGLDVQAKSLSDVLYIFRITTPVLFFIYISKGIKIASLLCYSFFLIQYNLLLTNSYERNHYKELI